MAFPDLFKLEKLKIFAYSDVQRQSPVAASPFEAMFNPQTLKQTWTNLLDRRPATRNDEQRASFVQTQPSDLQLDLLLDGTGVHEFGWRGASVQERIDRFMKLAVLPRSNPGEPAYLRVQWGRFTFECRLTSVTVTYTSFDRDGSALRAELAITLAADSDAAKQQAKATPATPDERHMRTICDGDTLPLLTRQIYGSAAPMLQVARTNGLDHIRGVAAGRALNFHPLAK